MHQLRAEQKEKGKFEINKIMKTRERTRKGTEEKMSTPSHTHTDTEWKFIFTPPPLLFHPPPLN
jgi:hypothetical protein